MIARRHLLGLGLAAVATGARGQNIDLRLPGGPSLRPLTRGFPGKGAMIVQRASPPLLETPREVFDSGTITPNDRFFVRWHWPFPTEIDPAIWRLRLDGLVERPLALGLADLARLPRAEVVAVNQCAGNSRGLFAPRVAGAQWAHGAMGNARWTGVRLKDVLDRAGVRAGAVAVRFSGLDVPPVDGAPQFMKSLAIDHARDGEVLLATHMNGAPLPLVHGFPLRLVVPGWYSTYWVKMLDRIEVLGAADDNYWMAKAYQVPATPQMSVAPGTRDFAKRPITAMVPRSLVTSHADGAQVKGPLRLGGIAFGGDTGVARAEVSADGGATWLAAKLGADLGRYSFRRFAAELTLPRGPAAILTRCTNAAGVSQPLQPIWNPGGYARGEAEALSVVMA